MTKHIPNIFTLLNLFFGCMAIVFILQTNNINYYQLQEGDVYRFVGIDSIPNEWWHASIFILLAAIVDFFDGFVARFLGASSELGKQLDSLADVVSFGVAPALILYQLLRMGYMQDASGMDTNVWVLSPAFLVACAAAYRLGKFNLSTDQSKYFTGVPVPAIGLLVASFPLILHFNTLGFQTLLFNKWVVYAIIVACCYLMVSPYKMLSLKVDFKNITKELNLLILAGVAVVGAFFLGWFTVPVVFILYVVLSLLNQHKMKTDV
jgi:CDP-diacylglycerol---serine O-phosphatidyltransferase